MLTEDEVPRPAPSLGSVPLDRMGVMELQVHIASLRAEIARAEAEIAKKEGLRNAADSVFRRP